jgi:hypothetical protein
LKKNGTQIGGEGIENLLVNMVLKKKTFKKTQISKYLSMFLHLKKNFQFGIVQSMTIYKI